MNNNMKQTNKVLLIVLFVLLCAFVGTKFFRSPALESNLDMDRFRIDTAALTSLVLRFPHNAERATLTFKRNDSSWTIHDGQKRAQIRPFEIKRLLRALTNVKPERIVSRKKEKWHQYQVSDSSAMQLLALDKHDNEMAEWFVGKKSQGSTYIRHTDASDIYAVAGDLRNDLDKEFNEWRDRTFLKVDKYLVDRLTFQYPADSGFVLEKKGAAWMIADSKADSTNVASFLNTIQQKELNRFEDEFSPSAHPVLTLMIEGVAAPIYIKAWEKADDDWILSSTLQQGTFFRDSSFTEELFRGKKWFTTPH